MKITGQDLAAIDRLLPLFTAICRPNVVNRQVALDGIRDEKEVRRDIQRLCHLMTCMLLSVEVDVKLEGQGGGE